MDKEYRLTINATLHAEDVVDAMRKIADHFQHLAECTETGLPQRKTPFGYDSKIQLAPIVREELVYEGENLLDDHHDPAG